MKSFFANQPDLFLSFQFNVVFTKSSRVLTNNFNAVTQKSDVVKISFPKSDMDIFGMYIAPNVR